MQVQKDLANTAAKFYEAILGLLGSVILLLATNQCAETLQSSYIYMQVNLPRKTVGP